MPTRCAPLGIVLPQGADYMVDPPPATSNLSQTEWLHKRHPSEYVPHSITSALLREQSHRGAGYPTSCITSCRLGQELLLFSAAGPARDLVSLTQVPSTTWSPSRPANPDELTYRPHYARLATPVLQLALNSRASQGWERVLRHPNLPILAARSLGGVDFFQLAKDHPGNIVSTSDEEVGGVPWRLNSLGRSSAAGAIPPARTHCLDGSRKSKYEAAVPSVEDFAWGRLLTQRGAMLRSDGAVLEVVLDPGHSVPSVTPAWLPTGHAADVLANGATTSNGNSRITSEFAHSGQMRCTFLANHPRHMVLCLKTRLALVDLRGPAAEPSPLQDIYTCAPGQWLTAVAAPDSCDGALAGYQHCLAAATATQVLLFDVRRPQQVLASWDHTMGPMNVNTSKHSSIAAVKSAGVDTLAFLPPIHPESASSEGSSGQHSDGQALLRLLASNARLGTGVVCEWTAQRAQRGGLAAREGMVWEVGPGEASAVVASGHAAFAWEPSCWTDITPRNPPLLLYSKEYPPALTAVIAYGQEVQRHRRQRQQRAAAGGDGGSASRPVNLLPSTWRPPVALGATVATLEWGTGVAVPRPVLAILKPTQEVVLAALDDANCSGGPRHEGHGSEVVAPAVLAVIEPRGEMEGGDCAAVNAAKDAEMAKLAAVVTGNASQPAFQVKKPAVVTLPLHKWLLEEAIQEYHLRYHADDSAVPMDTDRPRGTSDPDMHPVRAALSQFSVHAPFTAHEAYAACAASRPSGANMEEILEDRFPQGNDGAASSGLGAPTTGAALPPCAVPQRKAARDTASRTSLRQRKNQGDDPTALPPHAAAFQAALEQVGILPLPDSVPSEAASSPGTKDLRSQAVAAGWRMTGNMFPSSQFEARLADWATAERAEGAAATSGNDDSATALGWSSAGQRSYRLASLRYQVPCRRPLESGAESDGAAAAARASARVVHAGTRGLGGGMVVAPAPTQVESGNAVHGASSGITMQGPAKAPSAKAKEALARLSEQWEGAGR